MMPWIHMALTEPDKTKRILVWHKGGDHIPVGVVAAHYDYGVWLDVADDNSLNFEYWQYPEGEPYK